MRIRRRFFSVFLAVLLQATLLLMPPYIVSANGIQQEFADGEAAPVEESKGGAEDGSAIQEDENAPEPGGENVSPEHGGEGTGDIVLEDENLPETGDGDETTEKVNGSAGSYSAASRDEIPPDIINSEDAFWEWVDSNSCDGNVILRNNAVLKTGIMLSGPLSIDTGAYGVTMDGGSIYGDLSIAGDGVDTPVLTVVDMDFSPWDILLPWYNVTARGQNGKGGVAVHIRSSAPGSPGFLESQGHIRSEGSGAIGVLFDYSVKAHFLSVSVDGENSAAVSAPNGASLYYGKLEASGDGSKVVSGGNILLDTCKISGNADDADVVNRKIAALAGSWLYWPLAQGLEDISESSLYRTFSKLYQVNFLLSGDEAHPAEVRRIYSQWDLDKIDAIDTSAIGETVIPGMLYDPYQGLGLEDDFPLDLTVDVRDGNNPCIISLSFSRDTDRPYVYFNTYDDWSGFEFEPEDGNYILWRSDDEGQKWYDFTGSSDVSLDFGGITYHYDEITGPVWFCIQEVGGEYSNIAAIYGYEGKTYGSTGGDRTGGDRSGENSVTSPAPEHTPELESKPEPESKPRYASSLMDTSKPSSPLSPDEPSDTAVQTSAELISPPPADTASPLSTDEIPASSEAYDGITLPDEWENDTTTAISGKRLRMMMDAGKMVTFIKNEVRLSFDTSALEKLDIGDSQLFTVAVARLEPFKYTVSAMLDGTELCDLPCVATLDGNKHDILVSGTYNFTRPPDVIPAQTHLTGHAETAGKEKTNNLADMEEEPAALPFAVFVVLGTGCVIIAAVFVRFRVKKHGR